jgi:hypothetical protein
MNSDVVNGGRVVAAPYSFKAALLAAVRRLLRQVRGLVP